MIACLNSFAEHEDEVRARLLELGLSWDGKRTGKSNWANIHAAIKTAPPGSPLHIAQDPKDWIWGMPYYNELVNISDLLSLGNAQRTYDQKQVDKWEQRPRPGQTKNNEEVITGEVMSIKEYDKLFNS